MFETKAAFARRCGVSKPIVTEWGQQGYLVLSGRLVDVEASIAKLSERPAMNRGGRATPMPGSETQSLETPPPPLPKATHLASADWSLAEAARMKEIFIALKRQLDYEVASGKLIVASDAESIMRSDYATTVLRILQIPSKVAPRIVAMKTAAEVEALLHKEFVRALNTLSDAAGDELKKLEART